MNQQYMYTEMFGYSLHIRTFPLLSVYCFEKYRVSNEHHHLYPIFLESNIKGDIRLGYLTSESTKVVLDWDI